MPRPNDGERQVDNFHLLGVSPLKTRTEALVGFPSAAENEARLQTLAALGVSACSTIRVRGHWRRALPVTSTLSDRWAAGDLDELLGPGGEIDREVPR